MQSTIQLIEILGAGALILWGLRLIKTGILRAFGASLRSWIAKGTPNRFSAALSGLLATLALQSSTATAVITGSFAARSIIDPRMAQAVMLGANVGTAATAFILSFDLHWLASVFILAGVITFSRSELSRGKGVGRAILGLGLMLLALQLLEQATDPLRQSEIVATVLTGLENAPAFALVFAAGLAVLASSSLAVVLFIALLAQSAIVSPALAVVLVAGANLGGAVPAWLAVSAEGVEARRLTVANLLVRCFGAVALLFLADPVAAGLSELVREARFVPVTAHLAFNIVLLVVFLPLISEVGRLARLLVPAPDQAEQPLSHLDYSVLDTPALALSGAAREALLVGDLVRAMLERNMAALSEPNPAARSAISELDDLVDARQHAIKLYLAKLKRSELDPEDERRCNEIVAYAINLEHVGDIIDHELTEIAVKRHRRRVKFSDEGLAEIRSLYETTLDNLQLAQSVFMTRDADLARQLMEAKVKVRRQEFRSFERHLARVQEEDTEAIETSTLHLDILRDLKRLNAYLASAAVPILDELGALRESRLKSGKKQQEQKRHA